MSGDNLQDARQVKTRGRASDNTEEGLILLTSNPSASSYDGRDGTGSTDGDRGEKGIGYVEDWNTRYPATTDL